MPASYSRPRTPSSRSLSSAGATPPAKNLWAQQRRFNRFRRIYNTERPHEALNLETPASVYRPPDRLRPAAPIEIEYPAHFEVRKVSQDKTIRWKNRKVCVSQSLKLEYLGLEEIAEAVWSVFFGPAHLGWLDERDYRIMDTRGERRSR